MDIAPKKSSNAAAITWHILVWLLALYLFVQILSFNQANITNPLLWGLYFIQLGVHEVAHIALMWLPPVMTAAAGSMSEIAFTSLVVLAGLKARSYWAVVFGMLWLMLAFMSTANYMADASAQLMPLVGPSPDPTHDWHFVFSELGWLEADKTIATIVRVIGWLTGGLALLLGLMRIVKSTE